MQNSNTKQTKISTMFFLLGPFIKPHFFALCVSTLLVFATTSIRLYIPLIIQKGFDDFILSGTSSTGTTVLGFKIEAFFTFGIFFLGIALLYFLLSFFQVILLEKSGKKIILALRKNLFSHMTFLPVTYFDKNSSGRLVSRVTGDIENMNDLFSSVLIFIFNDLLLFLGTLIILFHLNSELAFYISLLMPVIFICFLIFSKLLRKVFRTLHYRSAEINHSISEAIMGINVIQSTACQNTFFHRFNKLNQAYLTDNLRQIKLHAAFMPVVRFIGLLSVAIILWVGSHEINNNALTVGGLIAFLSYMRLFFQPLRDLSEKFNLLQKSIASAERVISILQLKKTEKKSTGNGNHLNSIKSIRFDKVDFSYDGEKNVLNEISFNLAKGKSVGMAGQTGSGKSSIINLIAGFYKHNKGHILINEKDLSSYNIKDIRNKIALVTQDPILFSGSIRENIQPQGIQMKDDDLKKVLFKANCHFLFEKFDGLDTVIKENGRPLSSGEKQLVCISRAFALDPDLIIFDEATSYVDSQSEQKVHDAIKNITKGRLSLVIAHRLSAIKECELILIIREGEVSEFGSHEDLMNDKGEYYHLIQKEAI